MVNLSLINVEQNWNLLATSKVVILKRTILGLKLVTINSTLKKK